MAKHPPKISGTGASYVGLHPTGPPTEQKLVTDEVTATWRTFTTALGEVAPAHVDRIRNATHNLRRYGG